MKLLTTAEAAETAGITRQAIAANIRRGKLQAFRFGKNWAVNAASLRDFIKARAGV